MQCPSCRFENMPDVAACGRCGGRLHSAAVAIDVHPPRASRRAKRIRAIFPTLPNAARRASERGKSIASVIGRQWELPDVPTWAVLCRMIVPGWPQIYCGRQARGGLLLAAWLILLIGGLISLGTTRGSLMTGLAVACHAMSVLDIVLIGSQNVFDRITTACLTLAVILLVMYVPAGVLLHQVAAPQMMGQDAGPFLAGDVLLVNHMAYAWSPPAPGDIVIYDIQPPDAFTPGYRIAGGTRIDRVLATSGQRAAFTEGRLTVNGNPSEWEPLDPLSLHCNFAITVPFDHCLILPSTDRNITPEIAERMAIVPVSSIHGRVYARTSPLDRFGFFH